MAQQNLPIHPRERLPHTAPHVLESNPKIDLPLGRSFITVEEFNLRVNAICIQFWKIQTFAKFVKENHHKIKERHLVYSDLPMILICLCFY